MRFIKPSWCLPMLLSLSVTACVGNQPPLKIVRYQLPAIAATATQQDIQHWVVMPPITVARLLDSDHMVVAIDALQVRTTRDHLWAAPLPELLWQGLQTRLNARLPHTQISATAFAPAVPASQLTIQVDTFESQANGMAALSGEWQRSDANGSKRLPQRFQFQAPLAAQGYAAMVDALGHTLDQLAQAIATDLQTHTD